jgi:hypothetical protein
VISGDALLVYCVHIQAGVLSVSLFVPVLCGLQRLSVAGVGVGGVVLVVGSCGVVGCCVVAGVLVVGGEGQLLVLLAWALVGVVAAALVCRWWV